MSADQATPRPWIYQHRILWRDRGTLMPTDVLKLPDISGWYEGVLNDDPVAEANAALIVAAVNSFDQLREVLRDLIPHAKDAPPELLKRAAKLLAHIERNEP